MLQNLRKCVGIAAVVLTLGSFTSKSSATILFSENFNTYSNGTLGAATNGSNVKWTRTSGSAGDELISSNRLLMNDDNGDDAEAALTSTVNTGSIYASFSLVGDAADTASGSAGDYFFTFLNTGNNQYGRIFAAKPSGTASTKFRIGVSNLSTGTANEVFTANDMTAGNIYTIVVRFDFTSKQTTVWVDPLSEASTSATANVLADAIATPGTFDSFLLRQGTSGSAGDYALDNLLVATTFAEVIPEPTSLATIALVGGMLLARRRA